MDPRPNTTDPLAAATADLEALEAGSSETAQDEVEVYGRIHAALASALAGAAADRQGPTASSPGR